MTKSLLPIFLLATGMMIYSCKKSSPDVQAPKSSVISSTGSTITGNGSSSRDTGFCETATVALVAGQTINAGNVSVSNDNDFIYVTYTTANGYVLTETHLYVGDCALIPVNRNGNPIPGHFPYNEIHNNLTSYTYAVPISAIPLDFCGCVAAHSVVKKYDANGQVIDSQTAWGNGTPINVNGGNWGMSFAYCSCSGF
jgi:hypothetical protein